MIGPGKYDHLLTKAREEAKATSAILIVIDGERGAGFWCQTSPALLFKLPTILRDVALQIEQSHAKGIV